MKGICQLCARVDKLDKHHIDYENEVTLMVCRQCHHLLTSLMSKLPRKIDYPIELICSKCNYKWTYKGRNPYYASCPRCLNKVKVVGTKPNKGDKK